MPLGSVVTVDGRIGYGVMVRGVPVGDCTFVQAKLEDRALNAMSKANTIVTKLRDAHLPSLWTELQYAVQPIFHYWLQHCYPRDCEQQSQRLDTCMLRSQAYASLACVRVVTLSPTDCASQLDFTEAAFFHW